MRKIFFLPFFLLFLVACSHTDNKEAALAEIDHLLLPVANQNITEDDFARLEMLMGGNEQAQEEIHELKILAHYKEYSHVGHGLASLHDLIKNGEEKECPGHELAHYYVFMRHGENELASESLAEAQESIQSQQSPDLLFTQALDRIKNGNSTASNEEINELSDAKCVE